MLLRQPQRHIPSTGYQARRVGRDLLHLWLSVQPTVPNSCDQMQRSAGGLRFDFTAFQANTIALSKSFRVLATLSVSTFFAAKPAPLSTELGWLSSLLFRQIQYTPIPYQLKSHYAYYAYFVSSIVVVAE
ncbi:hypothetical protein [Fischerella thermalis]|uniref:Uncharacterized protein n=1 Tax=Fischerella thermalis JSC-11 TaxID=741277 RepID=G6FNM6_9CYAN|nr:hypothetical protein FJSC11DRAFT_0473 [Fischerella thermalis JSC-11]